MTIDQPPTIATALVVPRPMSVEPAGASFEITAKSAIVTSTADGETARIAGYLAALLRRSTGFALPVVTDDADPTGNIVVGLGGATTGNEGYELNVSADSVTLTAARGAGLFNGVQTLRQLLPGRIESATVQPAPWTVPGCLIKDRPRFAWRGAMLDVARRFFGVEAVKRYIDDLVPYKINVLHLHLTDDQGWRIAIDKWPRLTEVGGTSQVGGGEGGFYTKADYTEIVTYAADRYVTIIPEIDLPGHTTAALSSYAELNDGGVAATPYTGSNVGFSSLSVSLDATWAFVSDVVAEVAALTPGPYLHVGGDEVEKLTLAEYANFVERVERIVNAAGKQVIGWAEIGKAQISATTVIQYWNTGADDEVVREAVARGARVLMSPASKVYLDMKYDAGTELGQAWAGVIEVRDAWDWDPSTLVQGVTAGQIIGVEAPIWTETLDTMEAVETMAFPRLPAIAEVAWSATQGRDWSDFRTRLGAQATRWAAMGLRYYRSPQVDWLD
ncbi:MAG: beta-N-acetylhexosaminidase [Actinomycetota bacterium]